VPAQKAAGKKGGRRPERREYVGSAPYLQQLPPGSLADGDLVLSRLRGATIVGYLCRSLQREIER